MAALPLCLRLNNKISRFYIMLYRTNAAVDNNKKSAAVFYCVFQVFAVMYQRIFKGGERCFLAAVGKARSAAVRERAAERYRAERAAGSVLFF